jgi:Trypsin/Alpha-lytic protease prodomain
MSLPSEPRIGRRLRLVLLAAVVAALSALPAAQAAPAARPSSPGQQAAVAHLADRTGVSRAEATRRLQTQDRLAATSERLRRALGARMAGSRIDPARGELVVDVLDATAAAQARAAGARPHLATGGLRKLYRAKASLDRAGGAPGLAWSVDAAANALVVRVPKGRTDARTARFLQRACSSGAAVRVQRVAGAVGTQAFYGGQAIYAAGGGRCSAGFNTQSGGSLYVLTAGHCTEISSSWGDGSQPIGSTAASSFPGNDYGAISIDDPASLDPQGGVLANGGFQDISGAGRVPVGSTVCKTGSTTGTTCGTVLAYDVTVNYAEGTVFGLTETNVCTQPGDSGGPLFAGSQAQGITSGGTVGGCSQGGFRSFFQPADEALSALGLTLL